MDKGLVVREGTFEIRMHYDEGWAERGLRVGDMGVFVEGGQVPED